MKFLDTNGVRKIKEYIDGLIDSIKSIIFDDEKVTAAALNDLNDRVGTVNSRLDTVEGQGNGKLFFGTCSTAGATAAKTVVCPEFTESDLIIGTAVMVSFDEINSGAVASLTLNVNNTGAHPIKKLYNTGLANLTSAGEIRASNYLFSYDRNGYWVMMNSDYNTTYTLHSLTHSNGAFIAYNTGYRYQLFVHTDADHIAAFNQSSNNTATTKTILTDLEFDPFDEIYYYTTTTTIAANANFSSSNLYYVYPTVDLRYTFNVSASYQALAYPKDVYLKITMLSNGKAKLASANPLATDLPSTNDGIYYLFLGRSYSAYQIALYGEHPIYYHNGTAICELVKDEFLNGIEDKLSFVSQSEYNNEQKVVATSLNDLNDRIIDIEGTIENISFDETDPVFTASAAHNISSSDITNWNNKVSNVQSDWNATSGSAVILNKPTIPTKVSDLTDDVISGNYVPIRTVETSIPQTGMLPNTLYNLGTLSGNTTFTLNTSVTSTEINHYYWTFETGSTVPTITWPSGLNWPEGSAPTLKPSHHYEISVLNNVVAWMEV